MSFGAHLQLLTVQKFFALHRTAADRYIVKTIGALNTHKQSYLGADTQLWERGEKEAHTRTPFFSLVPQPRDCLRSYCSVIVRILRPCRGDCNDTDLHFSQSSPLQGFFYVATTVERVYGIILIWGQSVCYIRFTHSTKRDLSSCSYKGGKNCRVSAQVVFVPTI